MTEGLSCDALIISKFKTRYLLYWFSLIYSLMDPIIMWAFYGNFISTASMAHYVFKLSQTSHGKVSWLFYFIFFSRFLGFFDRNNLRNSCQENFTCPEILLINSTICQSLKSTLKSRIGNILVVIFSHFTKADFWNFIYQRIWESG